MDSNKDSVQNNLMEQDYFVKNFKEFKVSAHKKSAFVLDWNCNGKYLASADNNIKIWKYKNMVLTKEKEFKGHSENIEAMQWHPTSKQILCTCSKNSVKLWKIRESRHQHSYTNTKSENLYLTWSPNGSVLAVGNKDNVITLFDATTFKPIQELKLNDQQLSEFTWDPKGSVLFVAACQKTIGYIYVYDGKNPTEPLEKLECHRSMINCIQTDKYGKHFATGGNDAMIGIWNLWEMVCVDTYTGLEGIVKKLSFSHDGKYLATASEDQYIHIYNTEKKFLSSIIKCTSGQNSVKWHPDEMVLAFLQENEDSSNKDKKEILITLYGQQNSTSND